MIGQTTYHGHLTADNVTIAGDGSAGDTGAESTATNGGTSTLTLRNSTVTGFETALRRQQNGGRHQADPTDGSRHGPLPRRFSSTRNIPLQGVSSESGPRRMSSRPQGMSPALLPGVPRKEKVR